VVAVAVAVAWRLAGDDGDVVYQWKEAGIETLKRFNETIALELHNRATFLGYFFFLTGVGVQFVHE
jgi:hypothetical protein